MTLDQAKKLLSRVATEMSGKCETYSDTEWQDIHAEMEDVVEARSDRAAADLIRWWGCWDERFTATKYARRLRQVWKEMNNEGHS